MITISYFSAAILKKRIDNYNFLLYHRYKGGDYYEKRGFKSKKGANTTRVKIK